MAVVLGGVAGMITGALGSLLVNLAQLLAKHLRNRRLVRRGEPAIRDLTFSHFWPLFGMLGTIAGASWTWRLDGTWATGAIAGACIPAFAAVLFVIIALGHLRA